MNGYVTLIVMSLRLRRFKSADHSSGLRLEDCEWLGYFDSNVFVFMKVRKCGPFIGFEVGRL